MIQHHGKNLYQSAIAEVALGMVGTAAQGVFENAATMGARAERSCLFASAMWSNAPLTW